MGLGSGEKVCERRKREKGKSGRKEEAREEEKRAKGESGRGGWEGKNSLPQNCWFFEFRLDATKN